MNEDNRSAPSGATHEIELGFEGPNKREVAGAVLDLMRALAAAKGETLPEPTPIMRPEAFAWRRSLGRGLPLRDKRRRGRGLRA